MTSPFGGVPPNIPGFTHQTRLDIINRFAKAPVRQVPRFPGAWHRRHRQRPVVWRFGGSSQELWLYYVAFRFPKKKLGAVFKYELRFPQWSMPVFDLRHFHLQMWFGQSSFYLESGSIDNHRQLVSWPYMTVIPIDSAASPRPWFPWLGSGCLSGIKQGRSSSIFGLIVPAPLSKATSRGLFPKHVAFAF